MNQSDKSDKSDQSDNDKKQLIFHQLEHDILLLQESMDQLYSLVHDQQESIDSIEEFIIQSKADIHKGAIVLYEAKDESQGYFYYISAGVTAIMGFVAWLIIF